MAREVNSETKSKWRRVFAGLSLATHEQKISWARTALETAFVTSLGNHVILFEKQEDDEEINYVVKLLDDVGELVDEFDDRDIEEDLFENAYFSKMANMYLKIRRQVSGADSAIDDVLVELDKLDGIPF